MTRILAAVLLCAASSLGCTALDSMNARSPKPSHLVNSHSAPRPEIQRVGHHEPVMGVTDVECPYGQGTGNGLLGGSCDGMVNGCVSTAINCNGCGDACGYGAAYPSSHGPCQCDQTGRCGVCQRMKQVLAAGCQCGGTGQCPGCQHLKTMIGGPHAGRTDAIYNFNPGPSAAQVAYPYYTVRGPRDFFLDNPPSIGPY